MTPTTTAQNVLDHLVIFLFSHNARFNRAEIHEYQQARTQPIALQILHRDVGRVPASPEAADELRSTREDILPEGLAVSKKAAQADAPSAIDPELLPLIATLVGSVDGRSRFPLHHPAGLPGGGGGAVARRHRPPVPEGTGLPRSCLPDGEAPAAGRPAAVVLVSLSLRDTQAVQAISMRDS